MKNDQTATVIEDPLNFNIKEEKHDFMEIDNWPDITMKQPLDLQINELNDDENFDQGLDIDYSCSKKDWIKYHLNEVQCYKCAEIISKVKR